ncbi:unnamed protein product [Lymnaea stagnalis]|uniref:Mitochondrial fission process protein 1 n=1 Tax=Lymnaea stagnalis TaxID=6523 RepID=A0AAV2IMF5_LYMST
MSDIFKDWLPLRLVGHSFAVAETLSYAGISVETMEMFQSMAAAYVIVHAAHRGFKTRQGKIAMSTMFDTLIFDGFASILIPKLLAHFVCRVTARIIRDIIGIPEVVQAWGPTVTGLGAILLCYETIDWEVSNVMNETIRRLYS